MNFSTFNLKKESGFTLVELLVVVSIISLLSSIVLASVGTARAKARDTQRTADSKQVSNALEMYYSDTKTVPMSENQLIPKYISEWPENFSISTTTGVFAVYTTYETKKTTVGNQKVGAILIDDSVNVSNVCSLGLSSDFPTCSSGVPLDQVINVAAGKLKTTITCTSPRVPSSDGLSCVCPAGTTAQYDLGVFMGCFGGQQFPGGGGIGGGLHL